MSVLIPEGYVLVPRGAGVAAKLLEAADEVGADQVTAVRSVTGGYHVLEEVAEAYGVAHEIVSDDPEGEPVVIEGEPVEDQGATAEEAPEPAKPTRRTATKK